MRSPGTTNSSVGKKIKAALATLVAAGPAEYILGKGKLRVGRMWDLPQQRGRCWLTIDLDPLPCDQTIADSTRYFLNRADAGNRHKENMLLLSRTGLRVHQWHFCPSPSGKGWHFAYQIPKVHVGVRIALQLLMGSDPQRETMNLRRSLACPRFEVCCLFRNDAARRTYQKK